MTEIKITLEGEPVPQSRPKFSRGRCYEDRRSADFKQRLRQAALAAMAGSPPLNGAVRAVLRFYRRFAITSKRFGDCDNLAKSALDGITGAVFADDSNVISLLVEKVQDKTRPRTEIEISLAAND